MLMSSCHQAGERFDKVAQECSEDKAKSMLPTCYFVGISYSTVFSQAGGSLGWMTRGSMVVRAFCLSNSSKARV